MSAYNLMRSVLTNAGPTLATDYLSLVRSSDDPETYRKALEMLHKVNQKDESNTGVVVNVTFDMTSGDLSAKTTVIEQAEEVPFATAELPAPAPQEVIDLESFLQAPEDFLLPSD